MADGDETAPGDEPPAEEPSKEYDQTFFLALAAKGKDAWNAWRRDPANEYVRVTFAGIDFSEAPRDGIDFSGFKFGDHADFSGCMWRGVGWKDNASTRELLNPLAGFLKILKQQAKGRELRELRELLDHFARTRKIAGEPLSVWLVRWIWAEIWAEPEIFEPERFKDISEISEIVGVNVPKGFVEYGEEIRSEVFKPGCANFLRCDFGSRAIFTDTTFGHGASFKAATFGSRANFTCAIFGKWASFQAATFGRRANFAGAAFGKSAKFTAATFGWKANFAGAAFGDWAAFSRTLFKSDVVFAGKSMNQWTKDFGGSVAQADEKIEEAREKRHVDSWTRSGSGSDRFLNISFASARFDGEADFSGRTFEELAYFTNTHFYSPPDFDAASNVARIDFTDAHIGFARPDRLHWTTETTVPIRLRALRKLAEDAKNHDLERDLYIEERKAERGVYLVQRFKGWVKDPKRKWALIAHLVWIAVMGVYWALADYGRSIIRPAAWLALTVWLFHWGYAAILAPLMPQAGTLDAARYEHAVRMVALGNAVPFVGPLTIDSKIKEFLFCPNNAASCLPPIPPEGFQVLVIAQNLFSITCVFFIGLALRNYFKIK